MGWHIGHPAIHRPRRRGHAGALFDQGAARGIPSLGIGDNGNEIGYGLIEEAVRTHKPAGDKLATRVKTDVLVAANTSNWGPMRVCAAIAALCGRAELFHSPEMERRMLEACVAAGGADGSTGAASGGGGWDAVVRCRWGWWLSWVLSFGTVCWRITSGRSEGFARPCLAPAGGGAARSA